MSELLTIRTVKTPRVQQIAVVSGKGGTGKTSLVACFAALSRSSVLADCDVDAADLHLLTDPHVVRHEPFTGGKRARIKADQCTACGKCEELCRFGAISIDDACDGSGSKTFRVDPIACEGCGVCVWFCPEDAVEFLPAVNGEWFISETRFGPMIHARLGVAEENSGKLVSLVRSAARQIAEERGLDLVLIDGSPGIGCPVIASITGADLILVVTEPTLSGLHDLERVTDLALHFGIPAMVCINKWDLNPAMAADIEARVLDRGFGFAGRVRYDRAVTEAQVQRKTAVETRRDGSAADIRNVWDKVRARVLEDAEMLEVHVSNAVEKGMEAR
ncbi:MAG: ATP-binding protein [Terracidiphilus sp.]